MNLKLLIFSAIISIVGFGLLAYVDWKIFLGVFLVLWGNNITEKVD